MSNPENRKSKWSEIPRPLKIAGEAVGALAIVTAAIVVGGEALSPDDETVLIVKDGPPAPATEHLFLNSTRPATLPAGTELVDSCREADGEVLAAEQHYRMDTRYSISPDSVVLKGAPQTPTAEWLAKLGACDPPR